VQDGTDLVALVVDDTLTLDGAVADEESLGLRRSLIKEEVTLGEVDTIHVLGHLFHHPCIQSSKCVPP